MADYVIIPLGKKTFSIAKRGYGFGSTGEPETMVFIFQFLPDDEGKPLKFNDVHEAAAKILRLRQNETEGAR